MKAESETYKAKLLSKDSKVRNEAINYLAQSGDVRQLELLIGTLSEKRIGNGLSTAIKSIGNFQSKSGEKALIELYGSVNSNEKKLIIEALLKLGTFTKFFSGDPVAKSIQEQLWTLLFGLSSEQLKNMLALAPEEFNHKLDRAWKSTKHWRK